MKVIFLDRDGVINRYPGHKKYVTKLKEFHILPGALKAVKQLTKAGFKLFIISNQAGVSKGIYSQKKLDQINKRMLRKIRSRGGRIDEVFYCIHLPEENCGCRKPRTGLIEKALAILKIKKLSKKNAYFVGDSIRDVSAGKRAGCATVLVLSGRETWRNNKNWHPKPDYVVKDLLEASKIILDENYNYPRFSRPGPQTRC